MVLEATMVVVDNSEWMRNGDYVPSRWEAQAHAVNIVFDVKTGSNPESRVGLITMAGKRSELLASLTQDMGKIVGALHASKLGGNSDLANGINIAMLALKHRENKTLRQRILAFVGSPLPDSEGDLAKLGKKLKKYNVALDIVSFGEIEDNEAKLAALLDNVNSADNSHLLTIPGGVQLLSDQILSSPILMDVDASGPSGSGGAGGAAQGGQFEFGVDPSIDPELAMALRMSLEEEQARQRATEGPSASAAASSLPTVMEGDLQDMHNEQAASSAAAPLATAPPTVAAPGLPSSGSLVQSGADPISGEGQSAHGGSEEAMLQQALALSRAGHTETSQTCAGLGSAVNTMPQRDIDVEMGEGDGSVDPAAIAPEDDDDDMDEEEAIARAIEMSLKREGQSDAGI